MKTCSTCKEIKSKSEFCKDKTAKDGLQHKCTPCAKVWNKAYRVANKKQIAVRMKIWEQENKEKRAIKNKKWKQENKERLANTKKAWQQLHKERLSIYDKAYHKANAKQKAITDRAYRQANPERGIASKHKRRALKIKSGGTYTHTDITSLLLTQNSKCVYCKTNLIITGKNNYHVDHRMPLFLGGSNFPDNLQLLCAPCNLSKSATHPDIYEKQINHNQN